MKPRLLNLLTALSQLSFATVAAQCGTVTAATSTAAGVLVPTASHPLAL